MTIALFGTFSNMSARRTNVISGDIFDDIVLFKSKISLFFVDANHFHPPALSIVTALSFQGEIKIFWRKLMQAFGE